MKNIFKNAFTLAEIMIVLTVIGILTAILLPTAFHSTPDENVMKFKKANSALYSVIRELASSGRYYKVGDMGSKPDGTLVQDEAYFCNTIAEIMSTKSVDCTTSYGAEKIYADTRKNSTSDKTFTLENIKTKANVNVDAKCAAIQKDTLKADKQIVTPDGVVWFEDTTKVPFGFCWSGTIADGNCKRLYSDPEQTINYPDSNGFDAIYKVYCIDVDGYSGSEAPFGYAIRVDGKILTGARADEWLKKSVQNKD